MRQKRWLPIVLCAGAATLAVVVYLNALDNPFVWDDRRTVVENASIRPPLDLGALVHQDLFRPLVNFTYAANYAVGGLSVTGYHLFSVLLHALNVVLLFVFTRRTFAAWRVKRVAQASSPVRAGSANTAAFAAASIFAVHPLMTQAVGYVSGRAEVLAAVFFLTACLAAQAWVRRDGRAALVLMGAAWLFALLSKEVAIALPAVVAAYAIFASDLDVAGRRRLGYLVAVMLGLMAGVGGYRLMTLVTVENAGHSQVIGGNVLVGLDMVRQYTRLMAIPAGQSIFHSSSYAEVTSPVKVLLNLLWLAGLCLLAWRSRRWEPVAGFGVAWFLVLLLPSSFLLLLDIGEPMAEQRVYLAACGFAMACGAVLGRLAGWRRTRRLALAGLAAVLVPLAVLTVERNEVWGDPVALWSEAVAREPRVWVPYVGLGDVLRERGDYAAAAEAYRDAARLHPESRTFLPLATCLLMTGRVEEAGEYFARADRLSPGGVDAPVGLALVARLEGRRDEARDRFEAVVRAHPEAVLPRRFLAEMYEREYADPESALRVCREIQAMAPATPGVDECVRRNEPGAQNGNGR
ncbi:MAG: tetratricopeptide repeat protein [Acidobacteria bacterium]|nr:tetratricopeptide repeat protein [Acidobacteriota bacterium]